jgi:hypothetical protein
MSDNVAQSSQMVERPGTQGMTDNVAREEKLILYNQVTSDGIFKLLARREKYNSVSGDYVKNIMIILWNK